VGGFEKKPFQQIQWALHSWSNLSLRSVFPSKKEQGDRQDCWRFPSFGVIKPFKAVLTCDPWPCACLFARPCACSCLSSCFRRFPHLGRQRLSCSRPEPVRHALYRGVYYPHCAAAGRASITAKTNAKQKHVSFFMAASSTRALANSLLHTGIPAHLEQVSLQSVITFVSDT